jgi:hypothetical protein
LQGPPEEIVNWDAALLTETVTPESNWFFVIEFGTTVPMLAVIAKLLPTKLPTSLVFKKTSICFYTLDIKKKLIFNL